MTKITLNSLEETQAFAKECADSAKSGDVFFLEGDLGAGKSTFARFFIQALCGEDTIVPSPTFTLVQEYDSPKGPLYHFDLYRLGAAEEAYELGIEDAFSHGICLIEWPERLTGISYPTPTVLRFSVQSDQVRTCEISKPE